MFSEGLIKCMKINGEWTYDEKMIKDLNLESLIKKHQAKYGDNKGKLMTATVLEYLQTTYPQKEEEYKLVYRKVKRFLDK